MVFGYYFPMAYRNLRLSGGDLSVIDEGQGLWVYHGTPRLMPRAHRHNDVEINFLVSGIFEYQLGGDHFQISPGEVAVFWAAYPHRLLPSSHGTAFWLQLPFEMVLNWQLSSLEMSALLGTVPRLLKPAHMPYDPAAMFEAWHVEMQDPVHHKIAAVEVQALVRRALLQGQNNATPNHHGDPSYPHTKSGLVGRVAQFITANFREPLTAAEISAAAHLSPSYAMAVFKEITGMTMGQYTNWCRVSEAQRLLVATDLSVSEVAAASGFTNLSSLYTHFNSECSVSPGVYRKLSRAHPQSDTQYHSGLAHLYINSQSEEDWNL